MNTALKRVVQQTAEVTGDLTRNKIADKITSADKTKSKQNEDETNTTRKRTANNR